jgi:hypothetical protein
MIPRYLTTNRSGGYVIGWDDGTVEFKAIEDDLKKLIEDSPKYGGVRVSFSPILKAAETQRLMFGHYRHATIERPTELA